MSSPKCVNKLLKPLIITYEFYRSVKSHIKYYFQRVKPLKKQLKCLKSRSVRTSLNHIRHKSLIFAGIVFMLLAELYLIYIFSSYCFLRVVSVVKRDYCIFRRFYYYPQGFCIEKYFYDKMMFNFGSQVRRNDLEKVILINVSKIDRRLFLMKSGIYYYLDKFIFFSTVISLIMPVVTILMAFLGWIWIITFKHKSIGNKVLFLVLPVLITNVVLCIQIYLMNLYKSLFNDQFSVVNGRYSNNHLCLNIHDNSDRYSAFALCLESLSLVFLCDACDSFRLKYNNYSNIFSQDHTSSDIVIGGNMTLYPPGSLLPKLSLSRLSQNSRVSQNSDIIQQRLSITEDSLMRSNTINVLTGRVSPSNRRQSLRRVSIGKTLTHL